MDTDFHNSKSITQLIVNYEVKQVKSLENVIVFNSDDKLIISWYFDWHKKQEASEIEMFDTQKIIKVDFTARKTNIFLLQAILSSDE